MELSTQQKMEERNKHYRPLVYGRSVYVTLVEYDKFKNVDYRWFKQKQHIFISQDDITSVRSLSTATRIDWIIKIFDDAGNLHNAEEMFWISWVKYENLIGLLDVRRRILSYCQNKKPA